MCLCVFSASACRKARYLDFRLSSCIVVLETAGFSLLNYCLSFHAAYVAIQGRLQPNELRGHCLVEEISLVPRHKNSDAKDAEEV